MSNNVNQPEQNPDKTTVRILNSDQLMQGRNTLHIFHNGDRYTLRVTASGKLILTK